MTRPAVELKGTRDGLIVVIDEEASLPDIMLGIEEKLGMAKDFLQGAKVIVELGERKPTLWEAKQLVKLLRGQRGLQVIGFQRGKQRVKALDSALKEQEKHGKELPGEENREKTVPVTPAVIGPQQLFRSTDSEGDTLFIRRTLRSGQSVNYHGNIVIIGDVNPGAEVIAGGDIVVLGVFRGMGHAGAAGNQGAVVAALRLQPTQLRIADIFTRSPDGDLPAPDVPEVAFLRENTIIIDQYLTLGERLKASVEERAEEEKREEWQWAK